MHCTHTPSNEHRPTFLRTCERWNSDAKMHNATPRRRQRHKNTELCKTRLSILYYFYFHYIIIITRVSFRITQLDVLFARGGKTRRASRLASESAYLYYYTNGVLSIPHKTVYSASDSAVIVRNIFSVNIIVCEQSYSVQCALCLELSRTCRQRLVHCASAQLLQIACETTSCTSSHRPGEHIAVHRLHESSLFAGKRQSERLAHISTSCFEFFYLSISIFFYNSQMAEPLPSSFVSSQFPVRLLFVHLTQMMQTETHLTNWCWSVWQSENGRFDLFLLSFSLSLAQFKMTLFSSVARWRRDDRTSNGFSHLMTKKFNLF